MDCMVKGFPSPQVTWKRLVGESDGADLTSVASVDPPAPGQEATEDSSATESSFVGSANRQYHLIRSGPDYQVYENGTLRISSSSASGEFLCAAANGIGPGISKVVRVTVNGECDPCSHRWTE